MKKKVKLICIGVIAVAVCTVIITACATNSKEKTSEIVVILTNAAPVTSGADISLYRLNEDGEIGNSPYKKFSIKNADGNKEFATIVPDGNWRVIAKTIPTPVGKNVSASTLAALADIRSGLSDTVVFDIDNLQNTRITLDIIFGLRENLVSVKERFNYDDLELDASGFHVEEMAQKAFAEIDAELAGKLQSNAAIAVFPIASDQINIKNSELALEQLTVGLVNSGKYTVVEKRLVDELLAEYDFKMSGLVSEATKTMGELLGADAVVFGDLRGSGRNARLNVFTVDNARRTMLANSLSSETVQTEGIVLLPIIGASDGERETITHFLKNYLGSQFIDASAAAEILPYAGNLLSLPYSKWKDLQGTLNGLGFNAPDGSTAVSGYVQRIGSRNILVLSMRLFRTPGDMLIERESIQYLEYYEALELWIKMPGVLRKLNNYLHTTGRQSTSRSIWSSYGPGVNRSEAEMLLSLLVTDVRQLTQDDAFVYRVFLDDKTNVIEEALQTMSNTDRNQITQERARRDISRFDDLRRAVEAVSGDGTSSILYFNWSRNGNRTRIEASNSGGQGAVVMEYSSVQEFMRKLRVFAQQLAVIAIPWVGAPGIVGETWDGYNFAAVLTNAPVPANFTHIKRAGAATGAVPMGGFYIAQADVTQRDYERLMRSNPSTVKNPDQPVTDVTILDAIRYCNALSIQSGLNPAYQILHNTIYGSGAVRYYVVFDPDANGYRLPTSNEWAYAETVMETGGVKVFTFDKGGMDITYVSRENWVERGRPVFSAGDRLRIVRPVFDYWKYQSVQ